MVKTEKIHWGLETDILAYCAHVLSIDSLSHIVLLYKLEAMINLN